MTSSSTTRPAGHGAAIQVLFVFHAIGCYFEKPGEKKRHWQTDEEQKKDWFTKRLIDTQHGKYDINELQHQPANDEIRCTYAQNVALS